MILTHDEARRVFAVLWVAREMEAGAVGFRLNSDGAHVEHAEGGRVTVRLAAVERYDGLAAFMRAYGIPGGEA